MVPGTSWHIHDPARPAPVYLQAPAGMFLAPPDDAEVLFNGTGLTGWTKADGTSDAAWDIEQGAMRVNATGDIQTRKSFGNGHLHVEWATPTEADGDSQGIGNSGVYLMGLFEIQVLDSWSSRSYADGQAGGIYGQYPPAANVCRAPGEWQSYDIFFTAPIWEEQEGRPVLKSKAKFTVYQNGVRIHQDQEVLGPTQHRSHGTYPEMVMEGPVRLQDHGNPVRYRNIWFRPEAKDTLPASLGAEKKFKLQDGFQTELWASDPALANPVVFYPADDGRVFVAESYRQEYFGIPDNRSLPEFLPDDLRSQTVEDRAAMYLKHHPEYAQSWAWKQERITWLKDTDGNGQADESRIFADGFSALLDGTGAGILVQGDTAWYACIPELWRLEDTDGDGEADKRESLHHGYGVRVALRGHDMHGLIVGPDGKLYFSIGDRGYNVTTQEGVVLKDPGRGAVFRCNLDGSALEVFASGLRNPQELCFDDFGNLWTGDNNCDAGDQARLVYVLEGGDCGWSMNFQYLPDRGPWMPEGWWKPPFAGQPAFLNAPIANVGAGPSGIAAYPGIGLKEEYRNDLFLADFRGGADWSGILRLTPKVKGAGFELENQEEFWWSILATDVDFLPDGKMMVSDWVEGWYGAGKGRLWTGSFQDDSATAQDATASIAVIPASLDHPDRRQRLQAQFALVKAGNHDALRRAAFGESPPADAYLARMKRLHGIWGLGQLGPDSKMVALLEDTDSEVRAQTAKVLGSADLIWALAPLLDLMEDENLRVRYFATISIGKIKNDLGGNTLASLISLLDKNDGDRWIRHAAAWALAKTTQQPAQLEKLASHASPAVRLGAVLALRHLESPRLAGFLKDADPLVAAEAAIAIYDRDITDALPALADTLFSLTEMQNGWGTRTSAHQRRAMHAANRVGNATHEEALWMAVQEWGAEDALRKEAIDLLRHWGNSKEFDALLNQSRRFPKREASVYQEKIAPFLENEVLTAVDRGRKVFFENPSASCLRCHDMEGQRSENLPEIGPDLNHIGGLLNTKKIREGILEPAKTIAKGFEIKDADGKVMKVSAMPSNFGELLSAQDVDDLVVYLESRRKPAKVLVYVHSGGWVHPVAKEGDGGLSLVESTWQDWAGAEDGLEVVVDRDSTRFAKPDGLQSFDAVFFYTTGSPPIGDEGKKNLMKFIREGGAFLGAHCATDTFYDWPEYGDMLGGYFERHPWNEEVSVNVENEKHPATQSLGNPFSIADEIYVFKDWSRDKVGQVLLSLNHPDGDFPISWTRKEGKGRVFYTSLGHRPEVWASDLFRRHLLGGTFWATRRK